MGQAYEIAKLVKITPIFVWVDGTHNYIALHSIAVHSVTFLILYYTIVYYIVLITLYYILCCINLYYIIISNILDQNISYHIIGFCIILCLSYYSVRKSSYSTYIYILLLLFITIIISIIRIIIIIYHYYIRILYGNRYRILHKSYTYIYYCINSQEYRTVQSH